jgi:hypothetical protein
MILVLILTYILQSMGVPEAVQLWQWFMDNIVITIILVVLLA